MGVSPGERERGDIRGDAGEFAEGGKLERLSIQNDMRTVDLQSWRQTVLTSCLVIFTRSGAMKRRAKQVCRQQPAIASAAHEKMFVSGHNLRRFDKETAEAAERSNLSDDPKPGGVVLPICGVVPGITEQLLSFDRPSRF